MHSKSYIAIEAEHSDTDYSDMPPLIDIDIKKIHKQLFELIELLRNGCIIVGDDSKTQMYRKYCLEKAYWKICIEIAPELISRNILEDNQELMNIIDISAMKQQSLIRPDLS